jgi:Na+/H+-dicarboxylate symporter
MCVCVCVCVCHCVYVRACVKCVACSNHCRVYVAILLVAQSTPIFGTVNMDGTAIYFPIAVIFLANFQGIILNVG